MYIQQPDSGSHTNVLAVQLYPLRYAIYQHSNTLRGVLHYHPCERGHLAFVYIPLLIIPRPTPVGYAEGGFLVTPDNGHITRELL
jgi:hypothetical protein